MSELIERQTGENMETLPSLLSQMEQSGAEWIIRWLRCDIPSAEFPAQRVKRTLITLYGEKCQGTKENGSPCEWARVNPTTGRIPLELDHINGDSADNRPENVRLLCPSCHALTPTFRGLNKGQGRGQKTQERESINFLLSEVARRTGRISLIQEEQFVLVHEAVSSPNPEEFATPTLRKQRFRLKE